MKILGMSVLPMLGPTMSTLPTVPIFAMSVSAVLILAMLLLARLISTTVLVLALFVTGETAGLDDPEQPEERLRFSD
jgi:hypothetical protein